MGTAATAFMWPAMTFAAGPMRDQCVDANEEAQDLRREGSLLEARSRLEVCIAPSCPRAVRDDCVERLRTMDDVIPTIVLDATDDVGRDLSVAAVTVDGHSIPSSALSGAIPIDPGVHRLLFESQGREPKYLTVVVREGQKNLRIRAVLDTRLSATRESVQRPLGLAIGGVGLAGLALGGMFAVLAKSTYAHALGGECGGDTNGCSAAGESDGRSAQAQARVSTIALVGGGAFLAAGAAIYFTAPESDTPRSRRRWAAAERE